MLIYGWKGREKVAKQGRFHCPQCVGDRPYLHKRVWNYFTLYFVPLFPTGQAGEFVECGVCGDTFGMRVLDFDADAEHERFISMLMGMALKCLEEMGRTSPVDLATLQGVLDDIVGRDIADDEVPRRLELLRQGQVGAADFLGGVKFQIREDRRPLVIVVVRSVVEQGRGLHANEREQLMVYGRALELGQQELEELIGRD